MHPHDHLARLARRDFLTTTANGIGALALGSLLTEEGLLTPATAAPFAGASSDPHADSVRLALPAESWGIASVQRRSWGDTADDAMQSLLESIDLDTMAATWHSAISRPPEARWRVLVAVAGGQVVGLATQREQAREHGGPRP